MPNIQAQKQWSEVRLLESHELARGGINGNMNEQAKALANRTEFLNQEKASKSEIVQGIHEFDTYALFNAAKSTLPLNCTVVIGEENTTGTGQWGIGNNSWNGTILKKSAFDPLNKAKGYTDENISIVQKNTKEIFKAPGQEVVAVLVDADDKVLLGYDVVHDKPVIAGLDKEINDPILNAVGALRKSDDVDKLAVLVDANNRILIGYDPLADKAIIAGFNNATQQPISIKKQAFEKPLLIKAVNHFLFYGQSLSVGAKAIAILSSAQMYLNTTFDTGPRMSGNDATTIKPLVEDALSPAPDGGSNRGETCCSGAANFASRVMMLENGINPSDHVIFASTAGRGGTRIKDLKKGSAWYANNFLNHINKALSLNVADYKVQVVPWIQGESDVDQLLAYDTYLPQLMQLPIDISADVKEITGQVDDVPLITYQCSYKSALHKDIALAQLDAVKQSNLIFFAAPTYRFPYDADRTHLTNVGYKLMGAYFGRAYKQLVIDNVQPDFLHPISACISENTVEIKFDVPKLPLQLDTQKLAATTDYGFKLLDEFNNLVAITGVEVEQDKVILTTASTITETLTVRYALDYLGAGLLIMNGASGNLRDSAEESVEISGNQYQLFNACPAFEITAFIDKGI